MCVRTKLLGVALYSIAMDGFDSLTVVELKQLLKEKGLPVSGKKAELIARLEPEKDFIYLYDEDGNEEDDIPELKKPSGDKVEMDCPSCNTRIRVPSDLSRKVKCPACNSSFRGSEIETTSASFHSPIMRLGGGLIEKGNFLWTHFWLGFFAPYILLLFLYMADATYGFLLTQLGCVLAPIFGIGLSFYGHSIEDEALKLGTLTGLVVVPVIFIVGLFAYMPAIFVPFAGYGG